jgi:ParB-like nuclease domain
MNLLKENLGIDQEFKKILPRLSEDEYAALEASILKEGCRDPLLVWDGYLVDGHHRREICLKHGLEFQVKEMNFKSREEAINWIIENQGSRRNLSTYDRICIAMRYQSVIAEQAKANQGTRNDLGQKSDKCFTPIDTLKQLAKIAHTSKDTVSRVATIEAAAIPEIKQAISVGEISINEAYKLTKKMRDNVGAAEEPMLPDEPEDLYDAVLIDHPAYTNAGMGKIIPYENSPFASDCNVWICASNEHLPEALSLLAKCRLTYVSTTAAITSATATGAAECKFIIYATKGEPKVADSLVYIMNEPNETIYDFVRNNTTGRRVVVGNVNKVDGFDNLTA